VTTIPLFDHAQLTPAEAAAFERFTRHTTLGAILQTQPTLSVADVIPQDEYTNDVLVPLHDGRYLSLEVTCLGELTAVGVWPGRPSAEMLLRARLAHGWTPVRSRLTVGNRILGYAACLDEQTAG
jgi:hypothetical protein